MTLTLSVASGCSLFDSDDEDEDPVIPSAVVVLNGGNFSDQNGYLTLYDPETATTSDLPNLGAFGQNLSIRDDAAYVSLNTFTVGRIDIVDLATGQTTQQIAVPAPREVAFLSDDLLLATNLSVFGANGPEPGIVSEVDLSGTVSDAATVGLYPEGIVVQDGVAYVANSGSLGNGRTLSVFNTTDGAQSEVDLGCDGPTEVFADEQSEIVVVCAGKVVYNDDFTEIVEQTDGQVVFVNASSREVVARVELDVQATSTTQAQTAYYSPDSQQLWVLAEETDEVLVFDTSSNSFERRFDVPDQEDLAGLSGIAYDHVSSRLYVGRLAQGAGGFPDFTAAGAVLILDSLGSLLTRFDAGPSPSAIELR